jgi:hypothetical protein
MATPRRELTFVQAEGFCFVLMVAPQISSIYQNYMPLQFKYRAGKN